MAGKIEDSNLADLVEVRVKLYSCRVCGIRYDNMAAMKQHYQEVHTTVEEPKDSKDQKPSGIKQEIVDDEMNEKEFVLVDETQLIPNSIELGDNQVFQIANNSENGQIVLQVIQSEEGQELVASEQAETKTQVTPKRPGRKRKNAEKDPAPATETHSSGRPKRMVVPNIKSEFVYEGISHTTPIEQQPQQQDESSTVETTASSGATYTLVQDGDVITAWQTVTEENVDSDATLEQTTEDNTSADPDFTEEYPPDYTPTSKAPKGRVKEPKDDDFALRRFPCPFQGCNYVAKYRSNLWDHKKTHTGEKPYVCTWPSCTMRFSQTHQLKLHLRSHTGERPYVCDWPGCNSAFSQKPGLKSHMLTHTGEKPFKCDYPGCGWTFRLKGALTDHKRAIHENAKKHVCEWPGCNKRFLQQCHLKKHIMGHADIKPFACDWPNCNYKAVTMAYVTNHRKTHTGEKNYECTYPNCNKRFVKSSHVNRHRQRCHPDLFMVVHDGEETDQDGNASSTEPQPTAAVVTPTVSAPRTRRAAKRQQQDNNQILYKLANQGEDATIYIQQEQVEEEMISDGVQFINGSTVVSEDGEHYIIAEASGESGDGTPIMIELKKEIKDDQQQSEVNSGDTEQAANEQSDTTRAYIIENIEY